MNISQKMGRRLFTTAALAVGLMASAGTVAWNTSSGSIGITQVRLGRNRYQWP